MAVGKNICLDFDYLSGNSLDSEFAAIQFRFYIFDNDSPVSVAVRNLSARRP